MSTILVIDDDSITIDMIARRLSWSRYHVLRAGSGEDGLNIARKVQPDLIILDMLFEHTPMQGEQVLQELIHDWRTTDIPVIIFTVRGDEHSLRKSIFEKSDAYLIPKLQRTIDTWDKVELVELEAKIMRLLNNRGAGRTVAGTRPSIRCNGHTMYIAADYSTVRVDDQNRPLTKKTAVLLRVLDEKRGQLLDVWEIEKRLGELSKDWPGGCYCPDEYALRQAISRLRQRVEPDPDAPIFIVGQTGFGYQLIAGELAS